VVYAIAVEQLERRVQSDQMTAAVINAMGGDAQAATLAEAQRAFDEWLLSEPEPAKPEDEWRQVMGLGAA
jgi:hypothetical protein